MKKCRYCKIDVDTDKNFCPICFNRLDNVDETSASIYTLRKRNESRIKNSSFLLKLFLFITVVSMLACVIVNVIVTPQVSWAPVVIFGELYIWVLVKHTIFSHRSVFKKVFLQVLLIILVLVFAERLSISDWLIPYVYPSFALAVVAALTTVLLVSPKRSEFVFGFTIIVILMTIVSSVFLIFKFTERYKLLNFLNVAISLATVFGYVLFGFDSIKYELSKKWHL